MKAWRIDDNAMKAFFALAQTDTESRKACLSILTKLWKKSIEGEMVENPSAFVWGCVKNVRNEKHVWG